MGPGQPRLSRPRSPRARSIVSKHFWSSTLSRIPDFSNCCNSLHGLFHDLPNHYMQLHVKFESKAAAAFFFAQCLYTAWLCCRSSKDARWLTKTETTCSLMKTCRRSWTRCINLILCLMRLYWFCSFVCFAAPAVCFKPLQALPLLWLVQAMLLDMSVPPKPYQGRQETETIVAGDCLLLNCSRLPCEPNPGLGWSSSEKPLAWTCKA